MSFEPRGMDRIAPASELIHFAHRKLLSKAGKFRPLNLSSSVQSHPFSEGPHFVLGAVMDPINGLIVGHFIPRSNAEGTRKKKRGRSKKKSLLFSRHFPSLSPTAHSWRHRNEGPASVRSSGEGAKTDWFLSRLIEVSLPLHHHLVID